MRRDRSRWLGLGFLGLLLGASPLAAAASRSVGEVYQPGQELVWVVEVEGKRIGHNWSRYEGVVDLAGLRAHHFSARVLLESDVPGGRLVQRFTNELWTDDAGRPLRASLRAALGNASATGVDATFGAEKVSTKIRQGGSEQSHEAPYQAGAFVLANNFVSHLDLAIALAPPPVDRPSTIPFFSVNVLQPFPLQLEPLAIDAGTGRGSFRDSLGEVLHLDAAGRLERVEVPAQKVEFRRVAEAVEPFQLELAAARQRPPDLDHEDVRIEYDQVSIAGTVTRPQGVAGRLPAVFFISGSGGQDRDGFASGIDVGTHEILDRLTREGFLVVRVDDRGVGGSTGPIEGFGYEELVADARQAVLWLQRRADVDASRIALVGHSEGGLTAMILAAELDVAAVVLMAAAARPLAELVVEQLAYGLAATGRSSEDIAALSTAAERFFARVAAGETVAAADLPPELRAFAGAPEEWLRDHSRIDGVTAVKKVRAPVLVLQGARDIQVSAERDAAALAQALDEAGHPDHELVVFPELDHLFKKTLGERSSGLDYLEDRRVDSALLDTLAGWLRERLLEARQ